MRVFVPILLAFFAAISCNQQVDLPHYGTVEFDREFVDQNGKSFTAQNLEDKVYISDFFFTHCPAICPKMSAQMRRIQDSFSKEEDLKFVSITVDRERDTIDRLRYYADKIGATDDKWHLLTASQADIDTMSSRMMVFQEKDSTAPGGYNHMGKFLLIDKKGEIRGAYNGVDPVEVDELMADLKKLLK